MVNASRSDDAVQASSPVLAVIVRLKNITPQSLIKLILTLPYRPVVGRDMISWRARTASWEVQVLTYPLEAIGLVRIAHTMTESTPIQSSPNRQETGIVDVFRAYIAAVATPVDLSPAPSA